MSILVILTPPCKTHLPTADLSATPIGNSADLYGRIDSQDTGIPVQKTTKFTKDDVSTVMRSVASSDPSTFMSSIVTNSHIYVQFLLTLQMAFLATSMIDEHLKRCSR